MSVAIPSPTPALATRPSMMSKPSGPRIQSRPSTSGSVPVQARPMAPRPGADSSSRPQLLSRSSTATSSSGLSMTISRPSTTATSTRPPVVSRPSSSAPTPTATASNPTASFGTASVAGSKDTSSSAGKIFAKPSKEWVLPERAKPGRKVSVEEPDNKRQSQNRLSQRAHRARRTDYIQTLEERLRQYEADEIHSNVRLQEVARALKADNERLKGEINALRNKCTEHNGTKEMWELERRGLTDAVRSLQAEVESLRAGRGMETIVRMEVDQGTIDSLVPGPSPSLVHRSSFMHQHSHSHPAQVATTPGPAQQILQRDLVDCPICPNPDPDCPCQQSSSVAAAQPASMRRDITLIQSHSSCGLCHSSDECLCQVVDDHIDVKPDVTSPRISSPTKSFKSIDDGCGLCAGGGFCACRAASDTPSSGSFPTSGIAKSSLSLYAPSTSAALVQATSSSEALPLRFRSKNSGVVKPSIWAISNATAPVSPKSNEAVCTGDPSNCDACRDDSFGREFCQNLFEGEDGDTSTIPGESKSCTNCSGNCMSIKSLLSPSLPEQASNSAGGLSDTPLAIPHMSTSSSVSHAEDEAIAHLAPLQMTCCGNPGLCGGHSGTACTGEVVALSGPPSDVMAPTVTAQRYPPPPPVTRGISFEKPMVHLHTGPSEHGDHSTLRPDQAWKQLKAHPNAKFASLALLADVVARRTTSLNPTIALPGPSQGPSQAASSPSRSPVGVPVAGRGASSGLAGQAGKKRNFELETSAVRDALKLLDRATPASSPGPQVQASRESKRRRVD
ncbi:hypothetical protein IAU60_003462 [Kwoniella sp. DSM 27419]